MHSHTAKISLHAGHGTHGVKCAMELPQNPQKGLPCHTQALVMTSLAHRKLNALNPIHLPLCLKHSTPWLSWVMD